MPYNRFWSVSHTSRCELCLQIWTWVSFSSRCGFNKMDKKIEFLTTFGIKSPRQFSSRTQSYDESRQFLNVLVSIIFHITLKKNFQRLHCTFSKFSFNLNQCRVKLVSFGHAKFSKLSTKICFLADPFLFRRIFFVIIVKNAQTVSLLSFVFVNFTTMILSSRSWRNSKYFTPFFTLAYLST